MKKLFKILKRMCNDFFEKTGDGYIFSLTWAVFAFITYNVLFVNFNIRDEWEVVALFVVNIAASFSVMIIFLWVLVFFAWVWDQTYEYFKNVIDEEWNDD